jgi:peptidoglycan hydrolase-like protein with peptidoglycan-binding domain
MTQELPRSAWTTVGPRGRVALVPSRVKGYAVHWPGTTAPIGDPGQGAIARRLDGYRRFHQQDRGWLDIAYQVAFDQAGRAWELRGITIESGANGNGTLNKNYGAVLLLLGPGEEPSEAMLAALADWHRTRWLATSPHATEVVRHGDIRPAGTDCPGPIVRALIRSGRILTSAAGKPAAKPAPQPKPASKPAAPKGLTVKLINLRDATARNLVTGAGVKPMQRLLGFTGKDVDGKGGPATRAALGAAQRRAGLTQDFIFGPDTASALLAGK